jgi:hypothetical protein
LTIAQETEVSAEIDGKLPPQESEENLESKVEKGGPAKIQDIEIA